MLFGTLAWGALTLLTALSSRCSEPVPRSCGDPAGPRSSPRWVPPPHGRRSTGSAGSGRSADSPGGRSASRRSRNQVTVRLAVIAGVFGVTFVVAFVRALLAEAAPAGGRSGGLGRQSSRLAAACRADRHPVRAAPTGDPSTSRRSRSTSREAVQHASTGARRVVALHVGASSRSWHRTLRTWPCGARERSTRGRSTIPSTRTCARRSPRWVPPTLVGRRPLARPIGEPLYNQAVVFDGGGDVVDRLRKTHLVPYGEYIPWKPVVGWISALEQIPSSGRRGSGVHTLSAPGLPEVRRADLLREQLPRARPCVRRDGAEFLVVPRTTRPTGPRPPRRSISRCPGCARSRTAGGWSMPPCRASARSSIPRVASSQQIGLFEPAIIRRTIRSSTDRSRRTCDTGTGSRGSRSWSWLAWSLVPRRRSGVRPAPEPLPPDRCRTLVILPTYDERDTIEWVLAASPRVAGAPRHPRRRRLLARRHGRSGARGGGPRTPGQAPRAPGQGGLGSAYLDGFGRVSRTATT